MGIDPTLSSAAVDPRRAVVLDRTVGRLVYKVHRALYRLSGGRVGHRTGTGPVLLLTTTGRRTGKRRTTPLLYDRDGDDYVVVASNGGRPHHPAWLHNVRNDPEVAVQVGRHRWRGTATVLDAEQRARLWSRLVDFYPGWAHYQTLTDRPIAVVVLTRVPQHGEKG